MPAVLLAEGSHRRDVGVFPEAVLINMLSEKAPSDVSKGVDLISRPGLQAFATVGAGPIRAVLRKSGVFNGDALVVSGTLVYRVTVGGAVTALTGTVPGTMLVSIDATAIAGVSEARIANGTGVYVVNDTTVAAETFPDSAGVLAVATLRGFWFAIRTSTQTVYSREPGATAWTALAFTSAESEPDLLVGISTLGDYVILHGEETTEFHTLPGTANPALQPVEGLRSDKGCKDRNTVALCDNSLVFVGHDNCIYRLDTTPKRISDHGLEERIRQAGTGVLRAWSLTIDGHSLYVLTLGTDATYAFDASTDRWTRLKSRDYDHWRAHLGSSFGSTPLAADSESGQLWLVDPERLNDNGVEIERYCTGVIPLKEGFARLDNLQALCAVGQGKEDGTAALIRARLSRDNGQTWTAWREGSLGALGAYTKRVRWPRWGRISPPGAIIQTLVTDQTTHRLSDIRFNVP